MTVPIAAALISAISSLVGAWQTWQSQKGKKERPSFEIPEAWKNLKNVYSPYRDMPGYENAINQLLGNQASTINAIKEAGISSSVAGNIAKTSATTNQGLMGLADRNAAYKDRRRDLYADYQKSMANLELSKQAFNNALLEKEMAARSQLMGAGLTNITSGIGSGVAGYMAAEQGNRYEELMNRMLDGSDKTVTVPPAGATTAGGATAPAYGLPSMAQMLLAKETGKSAWPFIDESRFNFYDDYDPDIPMNEFLVDTPETRSYWEGSKQNRDKQSLDKMLFMSSYLNR